MIFKKIKDKNDRFWAKLYGPETKFAAKGKWYAIIPIAIILVGMIMLLIPNVGLNLGLDFTGGSVIEATGFTTQLQVNAAKNDVISYLKSEGIKYDITTPQYTTGSQGISVKYQIKKGADMDAIATGISDAIKNANNDVSVTVNATETISASASGERILMTFISIAVSLIAILIYMLFRFKFTSGVAALIGLFHDALIALSLCIIFRVQINYPFVAAIVTVVVYSINNTIVLFDRVRGKEKQLSTLAGGRMDVEKIMDDSVKEVFARTMSTMLTTLVPVIALCCLPVPQIKEFAFPILFGLIASVFGEIFINSSLYVRFEKYNARRKKEKALVKQESLISAD